MNKIMMAACAALGIGMMHAAEVTGSSEKKSVAITPKATETVARVKLVSGYDSYFGETGEGAFWYKMTLKRGTACSVWLTDASEDGMEIASVSTSFDSMEIVNAMFMQESIGSQIRWILYDDSWFMSSLVGSEWWDPASVVFYVKVSGDIGDTAVLHYMQGVALPDGTETNPRVITVTENDGGTGGELNADYGWKFCYKANLVAGRKYMFATQGGSAGYRVSLDEFKTGITAYYPGWASDGNTSFTYVPPTSDEYVFTVSGAQTSAPVPIALLYKAMPQLPVGSHAATPIAAGETKSLVPGRVNQPGSQYYDPIIDQSLFRFTAEKGSSYGISTSGAVTNLILRVYDASGAIIAEGGDNGIGGYDVQVAFTASSAGNYYFGVCQKLKNDDEDPLVGGAVSVTLSEVSPVEGAPDEWDCADDTYAGASFLKPVPATAETANSPLTVDPVGHGPHALGLTDWVDTFAIAVRKGISYTIKTSVIGGHRSTHNLKAELFTTDAKKKGKETAVPFSGDINYAALQPIAFTATANTIYYLRISVADGQGIEYPRYLVHSAAYSADGSGLGALSVSPQGSEQATWYLGRDKNPLYGIGATIHLVPGSYTVNYSTLKDFSAPPAHAVTIVAGQTVVLDGDYYSDKSDHKDDNEKGATKWSLKNTETSYERTLWSDDPADYFCIDGKDGYLYDFALSGNDAGAVFSITGTAVQNVTSVKQIALPKGKYYLVVTHGTPGAGGKYKVSGLYANVGAIKFAKTALTVKDTDTYATLTVNRTAKDGQLKVAYRTIDGSARAGENYIAKSGVLVWENKDSKAKTVQIKLIPKPGAWYNGGDRSFQVELEDAHGEYPAPITTPRVTVTIKESSKANVDAASVYAKKKAKTATVKTETSSLDAGTFYGVLGAESGKLSTGLPMYASVTLTTTAGTATKPASFSGKIALAGKTYSFKNGDGWDSEEGGKYRKSLDFELTVNRIKYVNTLDIEVSGGDTAGDGWKSQICLAALRMNVPSADGKSVTADVGYHGGIYRQNAKIQGYLDAVNPFVGYYTVALVPGAVKGTAGLVECGKGVPAGHGYITITIDNKGTAKLGGLLADNTKVSASATATPVFAAGDSVNGWEMIIPVYQAKSPFCLGGELRIIAQNDSGRLDGRTCKLVVDSAGSFLNWANDNAQLTYDAVTGWFMELKPAGGWYDTVFNLQSHYRDYALRVSTAEITAFPADDLAGGFTYNTTIQANGFEVDLAGDKLDTLKKSLVKDKTTKLNDWGDSVNPCNVQVKLTRATGVITGSFSVWTDGVNGGKAVQKEVSGIKHYGVITLDRADGNPLDMAGGEVLSSGFFIKAVKVPDAKKSRTWNWSMPFDLVSPLVPAN